MDGSWQERRDAGRQLRKIVPRSSHADWTRPVHGRDAIDVLEDQAASRLPDLVPLRYARMAESPFGFLRGAAAVMALDLSATPATGLNVQACGDAHIRNFGHFATPERNLAFSINDFDETLPAPWEWDVKRLSTSLLLVARKHGFPPASAARWSRRLFAPTGRTWRGTPPWEHSSFGTTAPTSTMSSRTFRRGTDPAWSAT